MLEQEQTILEIGVRQMWPLAAILGTGGLGFVLVEVFTVPGVSLFTMLAVLCLFGAVTVMVGWASPTPILRASSTGIRLRNDHEIPWTDVRTLVLVSREVMSVDGPSTVVYLILTSHDGTEAGKVQVDEFETDPHVIGWCVLPFSVADAETAVFAVTLHALRPTLSVIDLR